MLCPLHTCALQPNVLVILTSPGIAHGATPLTLKLLRWGLATRLPASWEVAGRQRGTQER